MKRYSVILGNLGNTRDRFCGAYKEAFDAKEALKKAAAIEGVEGVELVETWDVDEGSVKEMREAFDGLGLECVSIIPDLFSDRRWSFGSLASREAKVRAEALDKLRRACGLCEAMRCGLLNFWPAQDGFDYLFQGQFLDARKWLAEGLSTLADEFPRLKISLEYKPKEPRVRSYLPRMADCLLLCLQCGKENLGVTIDTGHSFMAGENVAEAAALAASSGGKLLHMHFNDNFKSWDDDMIAGSVHTLEYVELLFWLDEAGYDGWLSMDQYPYREDAAGAIGESVKWLKAFDEIVRSAKGRIRAAVKEGGPVESSALMRSLLLNR